MKKILVPFLFFYSVSIACGATADPSVLQMDSASVNRAQVATSTTLSEDAIGRIRNDVDAKIERVVLPSADVAAYDPTVLTDEVKDEIVDDVVEQVKLSLIEEYSLISPFEQKGFFFDMFAHVTLLRDRDFVPGATLSFGYRNGMSLYGLYGRFDYFLRPLGSETGRLATIEFNTEAGVSFRYAVASQGWQEVKIGVDFGYFMQWLEWSGKGMEFFLTYNGLMIRPTISIKANLFLFRIELGLYYQTAVYPRYEDYDGFGLYIKLF